MSDSSMSEGPCHAHVVTAISKHCRPSGGGLEEAKVVAAASGTELIQLIAAL